MKRLMATYIPSELKPDLEPFPRNGAVLEYRISQSTSERGPFVVSAQGLSAANHYQIRLYEVDAERLAASLLLPGGVEISTALPQGSYRAVVSTGPQWYGLEKGFWWFGTDVHSQRIIHIEQAEDGSMVGQHLNLLAWLRDAAL